MEALMGKWQVIREETVGLEEFLKAAGLSSEVVDIYKNLDYTVETTKDGDSYKTHIVFEGVGEQDYTWKFDEEFEFQSIDGTKPKVVISKGDGCIKESYKLADVNREWTVCRKIEGDLMIALTESKNGSMTQKLKKV